VNRKRVLAVLLALALAVPSNAVPLLASSSVVSTNSILGEENSSTKDENNQTTNSQGSEQTNTGNTQNNEGGPGSNTGEGGQQTQAPQEGEQQTQKPQDGDGQQTQKPQNPDSDSQEPTTDQNQGGSGSSDTNTNQGGSEGSSTGDTGTTPPTEGTETENKEIPLNSLENLTSIIQGQKAIIPAKVTKVSAGVFNQDSFQNVKIVEFEAGSKVTEIEVGAFQGSHVEEIMIPAEVTELKANTFSSTDIKSIKFAEGSKLESIGDSCFRMCQDLETVILPSTTKKIGSNAFSRCESLKIISMSGVEEIGDEAFQNCSSLGDVLSSCTSIKKIGSYAFSSCYGMKEIKLTNTNSGQSVQFGQGVFQGCSGLERVYLPIGLQAIPDQAFSGCSKLNYVEIDDPAGSLVYQITSIGSKAFSGCSALTKIEIGEKVSSIKEKAFEDCSALTMVEIRNQGGEAGISNIQIAETAFPNAGSRLTMRGYGGTVEDYAGKHKYRYESLLTKYNISVKTVSHGKIEAPSSARQGEDVQIKLTADDDYRLKAGSISASGIPITNFVRISGKTVIYQFKMPNKAVSITATFEKAEEYTNLKVDLNNYDYSKVEWDSKASTLVFKKSGSTANMEIKNGTTLIGPWAFNFSSSNDKVASVTSDGVIRSVGEGTCTIMAVLISTSNTEQKVSIKVTVEENSIVEKTSFSFSDLGKGKDASEEEKDLSGLQVIRFKTSNLQDSSKTFSVKLTAFDDKGEELIVPTTWSVMDTGIAKVSSEHSSNNKNEVTILKNAVGETIISAKIVNNDVGKTEIVSKFIVQVVDATPRLAEESIRVNKTSTAGTKISLLPVYGYEINESSLFVEEQYTEKNATKYRAFKGLSVEDGHIIASGSAPEGTYDKLYIEGTFAGNDDTAFRVAIPELVIIKEELAPEIELKGKLNLFYSGEEAGEVTLTQNMKDVEIEKYELVSEKRYKDKKIDEKDDLFAANFIVGEPDNSDNGKAIISRKDGELKQDDNNKDVVSGYLYIYYKGYSEPSKLKITIPTNRVAPTYKLSKTKATANTLATGQSFDLQLLDKKKNPIELETLEALSFDESDKGTTSGLFEDLDIDEAKKNDTITLRVKNTPRKGKAVFNVRLKSWSKPIKYTFNLSTTSKMPKIKFTSKTLTLNNRLPSRGDTVTVTLDQEEAKLLDSTEFSYKGRSVGSAGNIALSFRDGKLTASIKSRTTVSKGSYKFTFVPQVQFSGSSSAFSLAKQTITVKVIDADAQIKLKKSSYNLNLNYAGKERVGFNYTWSNVPQDGNCTLDMSNMILDNNKAAARAMASKIKFSLDESTKTAYVQLTGQTPKGRYVYTVRGMKLKFGSDTLNIKPFKITVQAVDKLPSISASAKGSLNVVDQSSYITITSKVTNINAKIEDVTIREINCEDGTNVWYPELRAGTNLSEDEEEALQSGELQLNHLSPHFKIMIDEKGIIKLYARDKANLGGGVTYKVQFLYKMASMSDSDLIKAAKDTTISFKQIIPEISINKSKLTMYAGERYSSKNSKRQAVTITKTNKKDEEKKIEITGVKWGNVSDEVKEAFEIVYEKNGLKGGKMYLELKNPAAIRLNRSYELSFETICDGQMKNTAGKKFNLSVTVKK